MKGGKERFREYLESKAWVLDTWGLGLRDRMRSDGQKRVFSFGESRRSNFKQ